MLEDIWSFSTSSKEYLQECLLHTRPADPENKWAKKFKVQKAYEEECVHSFDGKEEYNNVETCTSNVEAQGTAHLTITDEIIEDMECEPYEKFEIMLKESPINTQNIAFIAENLSVNTIEKICNHFFEENNIENTILTNFYSYFVPAFLKRKDCRYTLDLLVNAYQKHCKEFMNLLPVILEDVQIPNTLLSDLAQMLNEDEKQKMLKEILEIDLTDIFQNNIFLIYTTFKGCKKSPYIQNLLENIIIQNAESCCRDKNFGKLLLSFLQEQKHFGDCNQREKVKNVIEINKTPFKKPCLNAYEEILVPK